MRFCSFFLAALYLFELTAPAYALPKENGSAFISQFPQAAPYLSSLKNLEKDPSGAHLQKALKLLENQVYFIRKYEVNGNVFLEGIYNGKSGRRHFRWECAKLAPFSKEAAGFYPSETNQSTLRNKT